MELRILNYFLTVAREGSINKAAEKLYISQPTLSRQLAQFEEELGKQLFIRGNKKITLTPAGEVLKEQASTIIGLVERTEASLKAGDILLNGSIKIASIDTSRLSLIAKSIQTIHETQPGIDFQFSTMASEDILKAIQNQTIDFGIVREPCPLTDCDYIKLPTTDHWGIIVHHQHHLAKYKTITSDLIRHESIILPNQPYFKNQLSGWISGNRRKLSSYLQYDNYLQALALTHNTSAIALVYDISFIPNEFVFIPLFPSLESNLYFIWKKYTTFKKPQEYFLETLSKTLAI